MIGQVLSGSYRLTDLVGSGGYADVYLARDLRTNTIVAVKVLHTHVARDPDIAARFKREAGLARRLQTPHVARILDSGQDPTSPPYMVMEFVQGLTVAELIRRNGPFRIPEALQIVDQLLGALGSAHALGIVHRDIKPQNLMIDAEKRLKVLDFGIARVAGAGTMTASGTLLGTPEYMASEQIDGGAIDFRADLYAAGAVLYQLLTGRPPYLRHSDTDLWELIRRVRTELPPPIRQLRPEVPAALAAVVERAMAKDPARRFQSAYEMRQALATAGGIDPPPPASGQASPQPPPVTVPQPGATQILGSPPPILVPPGGSPPGQSPPGYPPSGQAPPGHSPSGQFSPGYVPPGQMPPGPTPGRYPPGPYQPRPGPPGYTPPPRPGPGPGPRRSGMPVWQIVGLGVGALILVVIGVALGRMVPLPGSRTPTPTTVAAVTPPPALPASGQAAPAAGSPTPASGQAAGKAASSATAGAAQSGSPAASSSPAVAAKPTAPAKPASATASPTVPPKPTAPPNPPGVLLRDDFERAETGQLSRTSPRPNDYVFSYDRGEYVINKTNAALAAAPIVFVPGSYENTVIAVDVRLMGDVTSRYAFVVCRDQSTGGLAKQYRASVVPEGRRLILSRWDEGNQRVLAEARDDAAINTGNAVNRLELRCAGAKISAGVNGKSLVTADDLTINKGDHGVGAGTFAGVDGTIEARFDNLEVRVP